MSAVDNVDWHAIAMDFQFERDVARATIDDLKKERAALLEQMDKLYAEQANARAEISVMLGALRNDR